MNLRLNKAGCKPPYILSNFASSISSYDQPYVATYARTLRRVTRPFLLTCMPHPTLHTPISFPSTEPFRSPLKNLWPLHRARERRRGRIEWLDGRVAARTATSSQNELPHRDESIETGTIGNPRLHHPHSASDLPSRRERTVGSLRFVDDVNFTSRRHSYRRPVVDPRSSERGQNWSFDLELGRRCST